GPGGYGPPPGPGGPYGPGPGAYGPGPGPGPAPGPGRPPARGGYLDFGQEGYYDADRTSDGGTAYYLAQVIGDVDRAFDRLSEDYRAGRFNPVGTYLEDELERLI